MKEPEYTFCMKQFKPVIVVLAILVVTVLGWTGWHCAQRRVMPLNLSLAVAPARMVAPALAAATERDGASR